MIDSKCYSFLHFVKIFTHSSTLTISLGQEGEVARTKGLGFILLSRVGVLDFCCSYCVLAKFLLRFHQVPPEFSTCSQQLLTLSHSLKFKLENLYIQVTTYLFGIVQCLIIILCFMGQTNMPITFFLIKKDKKLGFLTIN